MSCIYVKLSRTLAQVQFYIVTAMIMGRPPPASRTFMKAPTALGRLVVHLHFRHGKRAIDLLCVEFDLVEQRRRTWHYWRRALRKGVSSAYVRYRTNT